MSPARVGYTNESLNLEVTSDIFSQSLTDLQPRKVVARLMIFVWHIQRVFYYCSRTYSKENLRPLPITAMNPSLVSEDSFLLDRAFKMFFFLV